MLKDAYRYHEHLISNPEPSGLESNPHPYALCLCIPEWQLKYSILFYSSHHQTTPITITIITVQNIDSDTKPMSMCVAFCLYRTPSSRHWLTADTARLRVLSLKMWSVARKSAMICHNQSQLSSPSTGKADRNISVTILVSFFFFFPITIMYHDCVQTNILCC